MLTFILTGNDENALSKDAYDEIEIKSETGNLELLIGYCFYCEGNIVNAMKYYNTLRTNELINDIRIYSHCERRRRKGQ